MNAPTSPERTDDWLLSTARNVTSQSGEDGILEAALAVLGRSTDGWCVEFGAWDGRHLSNTHQLIAACGFHAVLIEGDGVRAREIERTFPGRTDVHAIHALVGYGVADGLDAILRRTPVPRDFDVLSIDIDGNDFYVWEAVVEYRPKLVVIEFNPTIPTEVDWVQPRDMSVTQGASVRALVRLGKSKGYELISTTRLNAIFVAQEHFGAFGIRDNSVQRLRSDTSLVTHIFTGYDGRVFLAGSLRLPWHGSATYEEARVQQLPSWLQGFPPNRSRTRDLLFRVHRLVKKARNSLRLLASR